MKEVNEFVENAFSKNIIINYLQIYRGSQKIGEYSRIEQKTRLNVYSVSKSVTAIAAGIAVDEGLFNLNDNLYKFFPEYDFVKAKNIISKIKIENLLTMTTGLADSLFFLDDKERYFVKDWIDYFFKSEFTDLPSMVFKYNNFGPYLVSCIIEKITHLKLVEFLQPRLFDKLNIGNPNWLECPKGHTIGASGLFLTIDEMSRIGLLLLNQGKFNGQQLVSKSYLELATKNELHTINADAGNGYGYGFKINDDLISYRADGKYGQFIFVLPKEDLMISCQSFDDRDVYSFIWNNLIIPLKNKA
ncbi:serine hydrolase domain-containing protein [Liquorilactobacillus sicerae]|uniref:serine hydrolase domain-containing protein n=1 Tax=Liquorilactobacillus sicerae TaxID=1416943 RepID=UPI002480233C|nr:serine hydrolase [Liquorilactobacillus sicerae]